MIKSWFEMGWASCCGVRSGFAAGFDLWVTQGCLAPVTFIIPPRSILSPDGDAAVVGGNVLTSQRLCDVVRDGAASRPIEL